MARKPDYTSAERQDAPHGRAHRHDAPLPTVPVPVPGVPITCVRIDWVYREGRSTLRPATPMTCTEFNEATAAYGATVDWTATTAAARAYAAEFGLVLEVAPARPRLGVAR
ncbi:hypothetical protein [Tsukamurella pseudospumae]|uniref:Uncharacterized protein n=1 Tax=Tsukamurella pseudospumae TaxID=239498 RepID=A0A138AE35_9ACTN|nr:hypothetical protein [Tsukamurella pseudospumae]KXP08702.1 hypothetical protein AXK60_08490 [Tsukamurella pseudospumae]